jgi:protein SCO1/2
MSCRVRILLAAVLAAGSACAQAPQAKEYSLEGQVLAIHDTDSRVVVKHGDIKGFMPGMTMPFLVKDRALLGAAKPGDFVTATLVVTDGDAWLSRITPTGRHEALPPDVVVPRAMEPPVKPGDTVPSVSLVDQADRPFSTADLQRRPWAVTFAYTRCPLPTFCPAIERRFVEAQKAIASDAALADARLVSVTLDPDYDTPEVLRAHAKTLGADTARWTFTTGPRQDVERFAERFGVVIQRGSGTPEDLVHSMRTAVVDRESRVVAVLEGAAWNTADLVDALRKAAGR